MTREWKSASQFSQLRQIYYFCLRIFVLSVLQCAGVHKSGIFGVILILLHECESQFFMVFVVCARLSVGS